MSPTSYILIALLAMCASFIQRMTGFGFSIFIMTVLPYLLPSYAEATTLSGTMALISALMTSVQMFKHLDWKKMWIVLPVFMIFSFFSIRMVASFDSHLLRRILGGALIAVSIYFFFVSGHFRIKPSVPAQCAIGSISGLMGGFFSMQGPSAAIYFLSCTEAKEQYMALISTYLVISNCIMTAFRAGNGFVTATVGKAWLFALPAILLGIWLGTKAYNKVSITVLRKVIYAYIAVAGVQALIFG